MYLSRTPFNTILPSGLRQLASLSVAIFFLFLPILYVFCIPSRMALAEEIGEADTPKTFKIIDAAGREVSFDHLPKRIVVIGQGPFMPMNLLFMFREARERLVGYEVKYNGVNLFLPLVDPEFHQKATLGTNPGIEQVAALHPDLVIMKGTIPKQVVESLRLLGIQAMYLGLETPEMFFKDVENLGLVLGNPGRAREISDYYSHRLDRIAKGLLGVPEEDRPRVLILQYSDRGGKVAFQVSARSWMQTLQAETAGGRPVWLQSVHPTDGWTITNFEQIAAWDPDKIFVLIGITKDPDKFIEALRNDTAWNMLRAVKNNNLYAFPTDISGWGNPEPRWILGMMWLAKKMHPECFSDLDIKAEVYRYFADLYFLGTDIVTSKIMPSIYLGSE